MDNREVTAEPEGQILPTEKSINGTCIVLIVSNLVKLSPRSALIISTQEPTKIGFFYVFEYSEYLGAQFRFQDNPSGTSGMHGLALELYFTTLFQWRISFYLKISVIPCIIERKAQSYF